MVNKVLGAFTNPFAHGLGAQRILKKVNPEFAAKTNDLFTGSRVIRRTLRQFDREPLFEHETRPNILSKKVRDEKKQRRLIASVRRSSIDG